MTSFKTIRARAEKGKGGPKVLARLLPPKPDPKALAKLGDDRILADGFEGCHGSPTLELCLI